MLETGDIGISVRPFFIPDGYFHNFKIEFIGSEDQVEIAKGVKFAKELSVADEFLVIVPKNNLGTAKGISERLFQ